MVKSRICPVVLEFGQAEEGDLLWVKGKQLFLGLFIKWNYELLLWGPITVMVIGKVIIVTTTDSTPFLDGIGSYILINLIYVLYQFTSWVRISVLSFSL